MDLTTAQREAIAHGGSRAAEQGLALLLHHVSQRLAGQRVIQIERDALLLDARDGGNPVLARRHLDLHLLAHLRLGVRRELLLLHIHEQVVPGLAIAFLGLEADLLGEHQDRPFADVQRHREGYPLGAFWAVDVERDANGDVGLRDDDGNIVGETVYASAVSVPA